MWNFFRTKWQKRIKIESRTRGVCPVLRWTNNSAADEWKCAAAVSVNYRVKVSQPTNRSYINGRGQTKVNVEWDRLRRFFCSHFPLSIFDAHFSRIQCKPHAHPRHAKHEIKKKNPGLLAFTERREARISCNSIENHTSESKSGVIERDHDLINFQSMRLWRLQSARVKSACSIQWDSCCIIVYINATSNRWWHYISIWCKIHFTSNYIAANIPDPLHAETYNRIVNGENCTAKWECILCNHLSYPPPVFLPFELKR